MSGHWRKKAAPIIAKVLTENKGATLKEKRKALAQAHPFGQRKYWPYKVWLDDCRVQLGLKRRRYVGKGDIPENPNQGKIF